MPMGRGSGGGIKCPWGRGDHGLKGPLVVVVGNKLPMGRGWWQNKISVGEG